MSATFTVLQAERAYQRLATFAVELLDAVTLLRVSAGVKVVAEGLRETPIVNDSGLFVWVSQDLSSLQKISIDPGVLPYGAVEVPLADLALPPQKPAVTTVQLPPRVDYAFAGGTTGARGTLIEDRTVAPRVPVKNAAISLRWLDDDDVTWHDTPIVSRTNPNGDFVTILRLSPDDLPALDANSALSVRLRVRRDGAERVSADLKLPQGRVADPSTLTALTFAWDELQP